MAIQTVVVTGVCPLPGDTVPASAFLEFTLSGFDTDAANVVAPEPVAVELVAGALPGGFTLWANEAGLRGTYYTVKLNVTDLQSLRITRHPLGNIQIASAPASQTLAALLDNPVPSVPSWNTNLESGAYDALVQDVANAKAATQPGATTNAKLAPVPSGTMKGRDTAGTGTVEDLTAAEVRALLNVLDGAAPTTVATVAAVLAEMDPGLNNRIRDAYEATAGRNPFTDALKTKLDSVTSGAQPTTDVTVSAAIGQAGLASEPLGLTDVLGVKQADASGDLKRVTLAKLRDSLQQIINLNNVPDTASFMRMTAAERAKLLGLRFENHGYYTSRAALLASYSDLPNGAIATVGDAGFERQSGAATFPDMPGFVPARALSKPAIWHWQRHGDGVQDDTATIAAVKDFCSTTGLPVDFGSGGTYLGEEVIVSGSQKFVLTGNPTDRPTIKLAAGENGSVINTAEDSSAVIDLFGICIDGQRGTRTQGHGVRSGGAALIRLDQVLIQNCQEYGFGIQEGTTEEIEIGRLEIKKVGRDATDVKNRNGNNGAFVYDHIIASEFALDDADGVGLDIRGAAFGRLLQVNMVGNCRGFRYRSGGVQGPAGFGYQACIYATGEGALGGNTFAVDWASSNPDARIGSVFARGVGGLILQKPDAVGGRIESANAIGVYLSDAISLSGQGLTVLDGYIEKDAAATLVNSFVDLEPGCSRNDLFNLTIVDPGGHTWPVRIQAGAEANRLHYSTVVSANAVDQGIQDLGTETQIVGARSFAA